MRRRLIDDTLTFISALCVCQIIFDIIDDVQNLENKEQQLGYFVKVVIAVLIIVSICCRVFYKKRLLVDTFDILKSLSQNNKLHPLREIVMVVNDQYEKNKSKYKIKNVIFQYTLIEGKGNRYNVEYEISLEFYKFFISKHDKMIKFYAILDTNGRKQTKDIPISISFKREDNVSGINFKILPKSVTTSKLDYIDQFSGLYEICFRIPEAVIRKFKKNHIQCSVSYEIKNNFSLTNTFDGNRYNFFIYPNNYGKEIDKCTVNILVPKNQDYSIECHQFCVGNNIEKILDFTQDREINHKVYSIFRGSFKPRKNTVYFVDLCKF